MSASIIQSTSKNTKTASNISVFIRIRPFNHLQASTQSCIQFCDENNIAISLKQSKQLNEKQLIANHNTNLSNNFIFDRIFMQQSTQLQVYQVVGKKAIQTAFEGINSTIFCYGQTSSGKTHTCVGKITQKQLYGILPRLVLESLGKIEELPKNVQSKMKISMVQIYNQKIKDLIDVQKTDLKIRANKKDGIFLQNVTQRYILSENQAFQYLLKGIQNRSVNSTNMNACSSRSHMLFIITINTHDLYTGMAKTAKISLVDLAGSEKISKTGAEGKVLEEAKKINASLTALGKVINALSDHKSTHIPYRQSKLTRLLQQSLGGNCLTNLIVNISPSSYNQCQTLTSLRFGARAKSIKNQPKINKTYTVNQLLVLLAKAEKTIKEQNQTINDMHKNSKRMKRNGGYGILPVLLQSPITMHILPDDEQQSEQKIQSESSVDHQRLSSQRSQSSYTCQFMSINSEGTFNYENTNQKQLAQKHYLTLVNQNKDQSPPKLENKMKISLPCFSRETMFSKSVRKISKVATLTPTLEQLENYHPCGDRNRRNRQQKTQINRHIRRTSSSMQKLYENSKIITKKSSKEMSTQTNSCHNQSLTENTKSLKETVLDNNILKNIEQIKKNFKDLKFKYLDEKRRNSINQLIIQRKNGIIENSIKSFRC